MDSSPDSTMKHLRRRLNQLGYRQHLGVDSVPLVSKVLSDLVHTTVSLRNAKLSASRTAADVWDGQPGTSHGSPSPRVAKAPDRGDDIISAGIALRHESTQTDEDLPPPPPPRPPSQRPEDAQQGALAARRAVRLQREVGDVTAESDECCPKVRLLTTPTAKRDAHTVAVEMQTKEPQEGPRAPDQEAEFLRDKMAALTSPKREVLRELSRKDAIICRLRRVTRHVRDMAWRKLSASKELLLRQQEVIKDLEDNLTIIKDEACEKEERLEEVKAQNDRLKGLVTLLQEDKRRLQDKMLATDRNLVPEFEAMRGKHGICGSMNGVMKSEEVEREYHQEAECSRRPKERSNTSSPIQGRKMLTLLADAALDGAVSQAEVAQGDHGKVTLPPPHLAATAQKPS